MSNCAKGVFLCPTARRTDEKARAALGRQMDFAENNFGSNTQEQFSKDLSCAHKSKNELN
jgi:hypothetical protein